VVKASPRLHAIGTLSNFWSSQCQVVVCECDHLTDFTYMDETFSYMGLTLTYFEKVRTSQKLRRCWGLSLDHLPAHAAVRFVV
jgi:hypothetical protein